MTTPRAFSPASRRSARASGPAADSSTRTRSPTSSRMKFRSGPLGDVRRDLAARRLAPDTAPSAALHHRAFDARRRHGTALRIRPIGRLVCAEPARRLRARPALLAAPSASSGPSAVTATVCSKCADRLPSRVTAVQPSASTFTAGLPSVHHRLDREHHALGQPRPAARLAVVRNLRLLVQRCADAVPDELAHHRKPVRLDVLLHRVADVRHPRARPAPRRSPCRATPRSPAAAPPPPATLRPTGTVTAESPKKPVELHAHVDRDDVAVLQRAPRDGMP